MWWIVFQGPLNEFLSVNTKNVQNF